MLFHVISFSFFWVAVSASWILEATANSHLWASSSPTLKEVRLLLTLHPVGPVTLHSARQSRSLPPFTQLAHSSSPCLSWASLIFRWHQAPGNLFPTHVLLLSGDFASRAGCRPYCGPGSGISLCSVQLSTTDCKVSVHNALWNIQEWIHLWGLSNEKKHF